MTDFQRTKCKVLIKLAIADYKCVLANGTYTNINARNMEGTLGWYFLHLHKCDAIDIILAEIDYLIGDKDRIGITAELLNHSCNTDFTAALAPRIEFMENQLIKSFE